MEITCVLIIRDSKYARVATTYQPAYSDMRACPLECKGTSVI